jgi:phenylacetate-CoA ligase
MVGSMTRSFLIRTVVFPLASWRAGNGFSAEYRLLRQSQWWPRDKLLTLQRERLSALLRDAFETVPFYKEWLGDHGLDPARFKAPEQLAALPVLDKAEIRSQAPGVMVSTAISSRGRIPYSTSGSTGEPFRFFTSQKLNGSKIARYLREMSAWGIEPGTPYLKVWGAGRVPTPDREAERDFFARHILKRHEELAFDLTEERADKLLDYMVRHGLQALEAYTSAAVFLAMRARERALTFSKLKTVVVSGETLTKEHARLLSETFRARLINAYGNREFGRIAFSCPSGSGFCWSAEDFYAEYLDLDPPDPSGLKRLVLTCFSNNAQPFIRYDTGDLVHPDDEDACCGRRGLPMWHQVAGRLAESVVTHSGKHISVHFFTLLLEDLQERIRQFQVLAKGRDSLTLLVVPGSGYDEKTGKDLTEKIITHTGGEMHVEVRVVEEIPVSGDGKRPLLRKV